MRKALWFSRHQPTQDQLAAIAAMGFELTDIEGGMMMGAKDCSTRDQAIEVREWFGERLKRFEGYYNTPIFGVFPVALRGLAFDSINTKEGEYLNGFLAVNLWESVNDCRSVEGGKPTFKFLKWEQTGIL